MPKQFKMTRLELKQFLIQNNIKIRPQYKHDDYMFTSFTMPYPLKDKLGRLCKKYDCSRSALIQMLIDNLEE
jgi:hypothetical protein